jgi:hypothetical protein
VKTLGFFFAFVCVVCACLMLTVSALVGCFSVATPTSIGICFLFWLFLSFFFDTFCIAHGCWSGDATRENASARRPDARPAFSSALRSPSFGVSGVGRGENLGIFFAFVCVVCASLILTVSALVVCFSVATPTSIGFFFLFFFDTFCIAKKVSKNARQKNASARRPAARPAFLSGQRTHTFGMSGLCLALIIDGRI